MMGRKKPSGAVDMSSEGNRAGAPAGEKKPAATTDSEEPVAPVAPATGPINVHFRLTYPLVSPFVDDEDEDSDDEDDIVLNVWPRFVFARNLCLVCLEASEYFCEGCGMISYCSLQHRPQAFRKHRELCAALSEIRLMEEATPEVAELTAEQYRVYRLQLLEALQAEVQRPLQLWEREIVLYPRVCRVCHRAPDALQCCPRCLMEFFCGDHENEHEKWCQEFRVFRRCLFMQQRHGRIDPKIPSGRRASPLRLPADFDAAILEIYGRTPYYCAMDCYTYATLSHMSTIPLTTLHAMQIGRADWRAASELVVHVVGAELMFECINLHVWEKLFLHLLPNLKRLELAFVGPELQLPNQVPVQYLARVRLCPACKVAGVSVNVTFHPAKLYDEVADSLPAPSLVCLFNPGLYRQTGFAGLDTWPDTIRAFCRSGAPVAVTSYTEEEIPREVERIRSIAPIDVLLEPSRNPFASIRPDRNFVSEDVAPLIYKNYYLTVVKGRAETPPGVQ